MARLRAAWIVLRARSAVRAALVVVLVAGMAVMVPGRIGAVTRATSTTLFVQSFGNNTIDPNFPMSAPGLPSGASGSNVACLTASGNTSSGVLRSCPNNNDSNGSGNLRLTTATNNQEGGAFSAISVPTSNGIDATFNAYQYGGAGPFSFADGIAFALAAADPANPVPPATIGQPGGALGYSANAGSGQVGLANAYMGIGLDVYGNFSNSAYQGTGCINPPFISTSGKTVPGQVVVRGPGDGTVGYCAINSTATSTSSSAVKLRNSSRSSSVVPVEVVINPTAGSFTTASGIVVPSGRYAVRFTPAGGGTASTLTGTLPTAPAGLYPSSSWTTAAGIPKQLDFGWVGSTGGVNDYHEVDLANVVSFSPVPQLTVSQTAYSVASPAPGAPVTYTVSAGVLGVGANEGQPISVTQRLPAGVTPVGAYGTDWTCAPPSGQAITCTYSNTPVTAGTTLPPITVEGIVTASGMTAATIQSGTTATVSSADGNPANVGSAAAGTLPAVPSGVTLSPASGPISGGTAVTVSGSNISNATAIEIGTAAQQQAGTPTVLLPCPSGPAPGCFTVNGNGTLSISSMPSVPASTTVNVTVVTYGVAGAPSYAYTNTPGTPTAPTATAGTTSATVTWSAPASNNSPITGYVVTPYLAGVAQAPQSFDASTTTRTITGLTAGSSYTFTVAAVNAIGTGAASPQSNAVIPYTLPGAPAIGAVSPANSAATVNWTAPASNGGSAITGYVVTPYIGGVAQPPQTFTSTATTQLVSGLTPGTSYTFTVAAINAAGTGPASAKSAAVTVNQGPSLTFAPPSAGEVSIPYSYSLTASGGTGALTWSVSAGSLPPGLSLNTGTGMLSGTPTASGSYAFTVAIKDTLNATSSKPVTLVIAAVPSLANPAPPSGQAGVAYSDPLTVAGGTGPFSWAVPSGTLPPGLSLNASTGVVSGIPTTVGRYSFTVKVTDSFGLTATQGLNITVAVGPLAITAKAGNSTVAQGGTLGYTITITNTAASAYSGVTFSVPLASVLANATYNSDAAATSGTVSYASPNLTWTGNLAAGAAATITFSITVASPYTGGGTLSFTVTSATVGTNCYAGSTDPGCTVSVPVSALVIVATTTTSAAAQGAVVGYTVTVTNSGGVAYSGATFTDPLTDILDNATYNGDAAATSGTVSYASPDLTWTGNLAAGAAATITFSVTVDNPDVGNKTLSSTVTSATAGSNCPAGSTDARCTATVTVEILAISSTADMASATPGTTVHFTVTVTNNGTAGYTGVTITDALGGLLDDASYSGAATTTTGTVTYTSPNLTWTGNLAPGATGTITFSVAVNNPDTGDKVMTSRVTTTAAGSNCPSGSADPNCTATVQVLIPGLTVSNAVSASQTVPGAVVGYTLTIKNAGQTAYTGIAVADSLAGALDDASYDNDAAVAGGGSVSYAGGVVTWAGDIAVGVTVTVTFSVTVHSPDTGDKTLIATATSAAAGSTCPAGATASPCRVTAVVLTPALAIAATTGAATAVAGGTVHYTVTITDAGQIPYSGITVTDSLAGTLDDASYNNDAAITSGTGTVSFTSPDLTWTGNLNPGDSVTVTFSATVHNPDSGNMILATTATSGALGSNCPAGGPDPRCSTTVTVSQLDLTNVASVSSTTPGSVVTYTITFTNTGKAPYTGITVAMDISDVLDDAVLNSQTASSGTVVITGTGASWTGDIPVGGSVTITATVTVHDPDTGNKVMTATLTSAAPGSNCPSTARASVCTATVQVLVPGLTVSNAVSASQTVPGAVVGYTLTIKNAGQTAYTGIAVADSLAGALDDASYDNDAAVAGGGSVSYAGGVVTWAGDIAVGVTVTVTFSVTVHSPDTGDKTLIATATSAAAGSTCPAGATASPCRVTAVVLTPALAIAATTGAATAVAGGTVHYTVTITDAGQIPYSGITVADDLSGVLDDAAYNNDAAVAGGGTVSFASPDLTWTGNLAVGDSVTVTFSATVHNPDSGNMILATTATSGALGSNCPAGGPDPRCSTTVTVSQLTIVTGAYMDSPPTTPVSTTTPGSVVRYSSTFTNTGQTPYTGVTVATNASDIFDDAAPNGDQTASSGTLVLSGTGLTWTGDIPVGGTVAITGTVTISNPDNGNKVLYAALTSAAPGSNCPAGGTDPRCSATVHVLIPALTITNAVDTSSPVPGTVVGYTLTIANSGQTAYTGITVTDSLAGALDDASYDNDAAAAGGGSVSYASGVVTWAGDIAVGATVTVTFSATVNTPDTGDKTLIVSAASDAAGSTCPAGATTSPCRITTVVLTPGLTIAATTGAATAVAGDTVHYTVTITDSGQSPYSGITVTDSLAGTLDDASYNNDAAITSGTGTVSFTSPDLTWTGNLAVGDSVTVTFSATVHNPDSGNQVLTTAAATSGVQGSNCPAGSTDPRCSTTVTVEKASQLTITLNSNGVSSSFPGGVVHYTMTVDNAAAIATSVITVTGDLTGVLDDASYNNDAAVAGGGTVSYASSVVTWTGSVPATGTVTITFSATVNSPDTGDKVLTATAASAAAGSNCPSGATDPRCSSTVTVAELALKNTASVATVVPGGVVTYTTTFTNTGKAPYTGITIATDSNVLQDAVSNGDQTASSGTLAVTAGGLTWTGDIPVGGTVTVTGSVTVHAASGITKKTMTSTLTTTAAGSNCPSGSADPRCTFTVQVLVPGLAVSNAVSASQTVPGGVVGYTLTIANSGESAYTGIAVADSLAGALDDASYDNDAAVAGGGSVSYAGGVVTWAGDIAVGVTVTVTFSVTVHSPDTGDKTLIATATSAAAGSTCPAGATASPCRVTAVVLTPALAIAATTGAATAVAGGTVHYTVTITDAGQIPYSGITVADDLSGVLDDAAYNNDAAVAGGGTVSFASPDLTWTGNLAVGDSVTVTFSATVHNPDSGNMILATTATSGALGSNCPAGGPDPRCSTTVTVSQLTIVTGAYMDSPPTTPVSTTTPGSVVRYSSTFTNTGQTPYTGVTVATNASDIFDDAAPNGDQTASSGTLVLSGTGLTWTGDIPVGGTVAITGTVTISNPDNGNKVLYAALTSAAPGSNCPAGGTDPRCSATVHVLIPALTITNAVDTSSPVPGTVVGYTLTIANSGQTAYTGITVTDSLAGALDDASYDNDAAVAGGGSVSYASGVVTWAGDIAVGATVTVTFSATVNTPDTGDKTLIVSAASDAAGSTCPAGATTSPCRITTVVLTPGLTIAATTGAATAVAGDTVHYTVTITDSGQSPYSGITVTDSLAGTLDDASYNNDAAITSGTGTVSFTSPDLTWTGNLAVGDSVTVTFSATVHNPDSGNMILATTATSGALGSNCPAGGPDPRCSTTVTVSQLTIVTGAYMDSPPTTPVSTTTPGSVVRYSSTFTNTGQTPYTGVTVATNASDIFDDAAPNGDQTASSGTLVLSGTGLTWTGDIPVGGTVAITGTVTISNPDNGNKVLYAALTSAAPGSNCPAGGTDPRCSATVHVLIPALTITKVPDVATTTPGSVVNYTITVADTGPTPYTGATVTDDINGVLSDSAYNDDALATTGTVSYARPVLTWTGDLAPGDTATITYSVTVDNPDTGDKHLVNTVTSSDPGSTCPPGGTNPACTTAVTVLIPALTITNTPGVAMATPGSVVQYTVTVADTGETSYSGATVTDDLTGALGSAAYNSDAHVASGGGTVSYAHPVLTWTGNLNPGDMATINYSVTVSNPETGPPVMTNTAISDAAGSNCQAGGAPAECTATVGVVAGPLSLSAVPVNTDIGHVLVGETIQGALSPVQVSDDRGFGVDWTVSVSSTDFITADGTPAETIPAGNATYAINGLTSTNGPATFQFTPSVDLSGTPQAIVSATNVAGNTSVSWDPTISVAVPGGAIVGTYSGTIVHSVS